MPYQYWIAQQLDGSYRQVHAAQCSVIAMARQEHRGRVLLAEEEPLGHQAMHRAELNTARGREMIRGHCRRYRTNREDGVVEPRRIGREPSLVGGILG